MGNQQEESNGKTLIETLTKRFTCKRYDPEGGVSDDDFATILEAARLSPSSFGFEPWKLLVIERPGLVDEIREQAWGAKRNADRTVVILARRDVTAESAWVHHIAHDIQGLSEADEQTRLETFAKLQRDDLHVLDNERTLFDWAGKQTYIALGRNAHRGLQPRRPREAARGPRALQQRRLGRLGACAVWRARRDAPPGREDAPPHRGGRGVGPLA